MLYFFLFKQKTAYEMRISDWSSDVCSSDLMPPSTVPLGALAPAARHVQLPSSRALVSSISILRGMALAPRGVGRTGRALAPGEGPQPYPPPRRRTQPFPAGRPLTRGPCQERRSEEHTSELQSLMRIS